MSWDELNTIEVKCPCGKGKVIQKSYMDDWNRHKYEQLISCPDCEKVYQLEKLTFSQGGIIYKSFYLVRKDYPARAPKENLNEYNQTKAKKSIELDIFCE
jgi:hypothetical protein